jgi:hypothetical protein
MTVQRFDGGSVVFIFDVTTEASSGNLAGVMTHCVLLDRSGLGDILSPKKLALGRSLTYHAVSTDQLSRVGPRYE